MSERLQLVEEHVRFENAHDLDGIMTTFGSHARYDDEPWGEHHDGRDSVRAFYAGLMAAAPDLQITIHATYESPQAVILQVTTSGTHQGWWRGLPPTGNRLNIPICAIYTFDANNRLAGEQIFYDRATVLRQLGVFHEPTSVLGMLLTPLLHPLTMLRAAVKLMLG
jgi:steroid delta-isomerase-like uncharacterized protein